MREQDIQRLYREKLGLRIGREMARYIVRQLDGSATPHPFSIIGVDARTGAPTTWQVSAAQWQALQAAGRVAEA